MKRNNRVGEQHGVFSVISFAGTSEGETLWECVCSNCGSTSIRKNRYFRKDRKTPRCCQFCVGEQHSNYKGHKELTGVYLSRIESQAYERSLSFEVEPEYLWSLFEKQEHKCYYTGLKLYFSPEQTASLDRLDNNKGYIKENVVWSHTVINRMKWDMTEENFRYYCNLVAKEPNVQEVK